MSDFNSANESASAVPHKSGPDAIHVGFSKCASTFLQNYFSGHPDIFLLNQSHFFAPFAFSTFASGSEFYFEQFRSAKQNQLKLESDEHIVLPIFHPVLNTAATTLASVEEVALRIQSILPSAKIVMVVRSQVSLIVSRYSEYILGGGQLEFEQFVDELLSSSVDRVCYFQNFYTKIFEIFARHFTAGHVLVMLQEDLANNEAETIAALCGFLGIRKYEPKKRGLIASRVGLSPMGQKVTRAYNRLLVIEQEMSSKRAKARIPYLLYKVILRVIRIADYYLPVSIKGKKGSIVTPEIDAKVRDFFKKDNEALAIMLHRDLLEIGY